MPSKRILLISPYFYPNIEWGGPVTVTWLLAKTLAKDGSRVEVLTTNVSQNGKFKSLTKIASGVKIIYAKSILPTLSWKTRLFISVDQIIEGIKLVPKFDVVHFQDVFIFQNIILSLVCKIHKVPYIISPYGSFSFAKERSKSVYKKLFYWLFGQSYFHNASAIIANSQSERRDITEKFSALSNKVVLIPHLIQKDGFKEIDIRLHYKIPKRNLIILFMARIYDLKGVTELTLGFLEFLRKSKKSATLILAGSDAGGLQNIKNILEKSDDSGENVIITGNVTGDLKSSLIAESDIVALLSKSETIPTFLIEGASFGKPVLCSRECNLESLVKKGGAVVTSRDAKDIVAAINKLTSSKRLRDKMGHSAKTWFKQNYDHKKITKSHNYIYEKAIFSK